jgi:hypothetical protein
MFLISIISVTSDITFQSDIGNMLNIPLFKLNSLDEDNNLIGLSKAFGQTIDLGQNLGLLSTVNPLLSTVNPTLATSAEAGPTFNPPLKKCDTAGTGTEGGFDIAKYVITGDFNKDKLKGNDFDFDIFADLVANDETEINGKDAPYKANILTKNNKEKTKVQLDEIATVCIDVQHVINIKKEQAIDLDKSALMKSLDY